jgi:hypothetical protein
MVHEQDTYNPLGGACVGTTGEMGGSTGQRTCPPLSSPNGRVVIYKAKINAGSQVATTPAVKYPRLLPTREQYVVSMFFLFTDFWDMQFLSLKIVRTCRPRSEG